MPLTRWANGMLEWPLVITFRWDEDLTHHLDFFATIMTTSMKSHPFNAAKQVLDPKLLISGTQTWAN